jgi:DNA-binding IclR family transcriptional regulator
MSSPQSVTRVIHILEALCASAEPVSLAQLSRSLKAPKSSIAALLRGLAQAEFVVPADGAWRLGPRAFGLGSALLEARRRLQSSDLIRAGMRRLADRSGETVLFAVGDIESDALTYVDVIESRNSVRFSVAVGDRRPLYCTAGGRALLAASPPTQIRVYFRKLRPKALTAHTEIDKRRLAEIVEQARANGFAQTVDQAADGATGTAAVVRDAGGLALGALIVAAPSSRLQSPRDELARLVREEAAAVSATLGFRPSGA